MSYSENEKIDASAEAERIRKNILATCVCKECETPPAAEGIAASDIEEAKFVQTASFGPETKPPTIRDRVIAALEREGVMCISPELIDQLVADEEKRRSESYFPGKDGIEVRVTLNAAEPTEYQREAVSAIYSLLVDRFSDTKHGTIRFEIQEEGPLAKWTDDRQQEAADELVKEVSQGGKIGWVFVTKGGGFYITARNDNAVSMALAEAEGTVIVVTRENEIAVEMLSEVSHRIPDGASVRFMLLDEFAHCAAKENVGEARQSVSKLQEWKEKTSAIIRERRMEQAKATLESAKIGGAYGTAALAAAAGNASRLRKILHPADAAFMGGAALGGGAP